MTAVAVKFAIMDIQNKIRPRYAYLVLSMILIA